jgi:hypothetical protein
MDRCSFIYNKMNEDMSYTIVYYDTQHGPIIKIIEPGKIKSRSLGPEESKELYRIVRDDIEGDMDYKFIDNIHDKEQTLLVFISNPMRTQFYHWIRDKKPPKGVVKLLEYIENIKIGLLT